MSNVVQLTPHLFQLSVGIVNCFLLDTADGLLLIDTGNPGSADKLFAAVRQAGHDPARIRHLLLTHCHIDHAGSAAEVQRRTGARTYAHALDAPLIEQGVALRPGTTRTPGLVNWLVYELIIKKAGTTCEPTRIDQLLQHGDLLPLAGGIEVIHTPGHSAGHVALLLRQAGILIAGDLCTNVFGLAYSTLNEDITLARQSLLCAATYPFDRIAFGHGNPLNQRAAQQLKAQFLRS